MASAGTFLLLLSLFVNGFLCCPEDCSCSEGRIVSVRCQSRMLTQFINVSHLPEKTAEIDIHDNRISTLSLQKVKNEFTKLQRINLENNYLTQIYTASVLNQFPSITNLGLRGNLLVTISFEEANSENLQVLDLGKNQLEHIGNKSFANCYKLSYLYLDDNNIEVIDEEAFTGLVNLKYLYLQSNRIKLLKSSSLKSLVRLERLQLENNKITQFLMENYFEWPKTFYELNLKRNNLKVMPVLPNRPNGGSEWLVDIRNNPVYCGCRNARYSLAYLSECPLCNLKAVCTSPEDMHGASVELEVMTQRNKCGEAFAKSFWKMYATKPDCLLPEIKRFYFNETNGEQILTCQVDSFPLATVQILQMSPERVLATSDSMYTVVNLSADGLMRCQAKSKLGWVTKDLFVEGNHVALVNVTPGLEKDEHMQSNVSQYAGNDISKLNYFGFVVSFMSMLIFLLITVGMGVLYFVDLKQ